MLETPLCEDAGTRRRRAESAILAHLARHPLAADTEQGIAQWWLGSQGVDVRQALEALQREGRIERATLPDGRAIFRAPRSGGP